MLTDEAIVAAPVLDRLGRHHGVLVVAGGSVAADSDAGVEARGALELAGQLSAAAFAEARPRTLNGGSDEVVEQIAEIGETLRGTGEIGEIRRGGHRSLARFALDAVLSHAPDPLAVLEPSGEMAWVSPALAELLGSPAEELLGQPLNRWCSSSDREDLVSYLRRSAAGPSAVPAPLPVRLPRPNGDERAVELTSTAIFGDGSFEGLLISVRDVSFRRALEERDERRVHLEAGAFERLATGVVTLRRDGIVAAINRSAARAFNVVPEEVIGCPIEDLFYGVLASGGALLDDLGAEIEPSSHRLLAAVESGEPVADVLVGHRYRDRSRQWFRLDLAESGDGDRGEEPGFELTVVDVTSRHEQALARSDSERRLRRMIDTLRDAVLVLSAAGRCVDANAAAAELFGLSIAELVGRSDTELVAELRRRWRVIDADGLPVSVEELPEARARRGGGVAETSLVGLEPDDRSGTRWFHVRARAVMTEEHVDGSPLDPTAHPPYPVVVTYGEVTDLSPLELTHHDATATVLREQQFLQPLLDDLQEGILACDAGGLVTHCNATTRLFFGLLPDEVPIGRRPDVGRLLRLDGSPLDPEEHPLIVALSGERVTAWELVVVPIRGRERKVVANAQPLFDADRQLLGAVLSLHDVTEQRQLESELTELALHDPLTGCANRLLLGDRLTVAFDRADREGGWVGLMLIDLDHFKRVNDTHGHDVGDRLLVELGRRLNGAVRPGDTVARLGGDEFVVVCPGIAAAAELDRLADRILERIVQPFELDGLPLSVTASLGAALGGGAEIDGRDGAEELMRRADVAMYRVKAEHHALDASKH